MALNMIDKTIVAEDFGAKGCGYDIVMTSNVLKDTSGPTVVRQILYLGYRGLLFACINAPAEKDIAMLRDSGVDAVLSKPFNVSRMMECIKG